MPRVTTTNDAMANYYAGQAPYGACFTADPGTGGLATNEVTGGAPAYARKALAWTTASGGTGKVTGSASFDIPAGDTVNYFGVAKTAVAGTNDVFDNVLVTAQPFASQGVYQVSADFTEN